jgi:hypothetical protein
MLNNFEVLEMEKCLKSLCGIEDQQRPVRLNEYFSLDSQIDWEFFDGICEMNFHFVILIFATTRPSVV